MLYFAPDDCHEHVQSSTSEQRGKIAQLGVIMNFTYGCLE
jgi:hypothetical protein